MQLIIILFLGILSLIYIYRVIKKQFTSEKEPECNKCPASDY